MSVLSPEQEERLVRLRDAAAAVGYKRIERMDNGRWIVEDDNALYDHEGSDDPDDLDILLDAHVLHGDGSPLHVVTVLSTFMMPP